MKLTIIEAGKVPTPLGQRFAPYPDMFRAMFAASCETFTFETVSACDGAVLPDPAGLDGIVITGSPAGVYEDHSWLAPLRAFIRAAYDAQTPMVGICFGHQIIADALGGVVRQSEKGWGMGRHRYRVLERPAFMADAPETLAVACSHQDQVIEPPKTARTILASDFTPNAGLLYDTGRAVSFQGHPEFADDYVMALMELRRGRAPDAVVEAGVASMTQISDGKLLAGYIARFFKEAN